MKQKAFSKGRDLLRLFVSFLKIGLITIVMDYAMTSKLQN